MDYQLGSHVKNSPGAGTSQTSPTAMSWNFGGGGLACGFRMSVIKGVCVCICVYIYIYLCMCTYIYIYRCIYIYVYIYIYIHVFKICIKYVYIKMYVLVYAYVYIYMYMYVYWLWGGLLLWGTGPHLYHRSSVGRQSRTECVSSYIYIYI